VSIFYRDLRSYGLRETMYQKAREAGVLFYQFDLEEKPEADFSGEGVALRVRDRILDRTVTVQADHLVLSAGLRPHPEAQSTAEQYRIARNEDGYFLEAHVKLRPVEFPSEGLFLAGLAHAPKNLDETVGQAMAAAGRAGVLLGREELEVSGRIAKHNSERCMSCLSCFRICPFDAPYIDEEGRVRHNEIKCAGCGLCAGICPSKAYQVSHFTDEQIKAMIDAASEPL
jgi:heterodisulfide reductase subunit A